jgi:hypothetical protein
VLPIAKPFFSSSVNKQFFSLRKFLHTPISIRCCLLAAGCFFSFLSITRHKARTLLYFTLLYTATEIQFVQMFKASPPTPLKTILVPRQTETLVYMD